tara:strand:+ start:985 stop:2802 length:1818 start_codon:yes stop_codon:yes gene_type:complete
MATVDELKIIIEAETKKLRKGLDDVNRKLKTTEGQTNKVTKGFSGFGRVIGALGLGLLGREIINTSRTFEDLEATLRAVTGGAENAAVSMDLVRKFTSGTTFQLENVASAFTTLVNAGIAPTSEVLTDFGNLAAGAGKDITQLAQAVFNATTGEMEMLKQFGVIARVEGDQLAVTFRGNTQRIGRDADSIVNHLREISQESFSTALEERLNTVSGVFSNFKDAVSEVFNAIGEGGLNDVLIDLGKILINLMQSLQPVAQFVGLTLKTAFSILGAAISFVVSQMNTLIAIMVIFAARQAPIIATVVFTNAMTGLAKAITTVRVALSLLAKNKITAFIVLATMGLVELGSKFEVVEEKIDAVKETLGKLGERFFPDLGEDIEDVTVLDAKIEEFLDQLKTDMPVAVEGTKVALGDMKEAVIQSSNAFTKEFTDNLLNGQNALDSFKNFAKNIVSQIIAIFLQMQIVNKILNQVFNLTGKDALPTSNFFGGNRMSSAEAMQIDASIGGVRAAGGGTIQRNTPTVVGERGAEIFVPNTGGTILNNMNSRNAMGGSPIIVNQSVNFSTGVVPTVRAEVTKMLPQISDVTKGAVLEAAMRGGQFRKGLLGG